MNPLTSDVMAARALFKACSLRVNKAAFDSRFKNVNWNRVTCRWQVHVGVQGRLVTLGAFRPNEEEAAARVADQARWWLQDYLRRAPSYNFPDELPPVDEIPAKVAMLRAKLCASGAPQNAPHHPEFVAPDLKSLHNPNWVSVPGASETVTQCCPDGQGGVPCDACAAMSSPG